MMRRFLPVLVAAATVCAAPTILNTKNLASADTDPGVTVLEALLPSEQLTYDEEGNAYYIEGDEVITGKFSLKPNFTLGDVNLDGTVDASDAFQILELCAELGSSADVDAAARIIAYADVDQSGSIDSMDAMTILEYVAKGGAEGVSEPIGVTYYYATPQGMLPSGLIENEETGEIQPAKIATINYANGYLTVPITVETTDEFAQKYPAALVQYLNEKVGDKFVNVQYSGYDAADAAPSEENPEAVGKSVSFDLSLQINNESQIKFIKDEAEAAADEAAADEAAADVAAE